MNADIQAFRDEVRAKLEATNVGLAAISTSIEDVKVDQQTLLTKIDNLTNSPNLTGEDRAALDEIRASVAGTSDKVTALATVASDLAAVVPNEPPTV